MSASGPVRVVYVLHNAARGGAAYSLLSLLRHFPPGTVEASAIAPPGPAIDDFRRAGVRVASVPALSTFISISGVPLRGWRLLTLLWTVGDLRHDASIRRILDEVRPDVVHLNESGLLSVARLAKRRGYPVVMHARSVADRSSRWINAVRERVIRRSVDRLVAIDESVNRSLGATIPTQVIYNPLRAPAGPVVDAPRERPSGPSLRVTFLSGLHPAKGVWEVVEAAKLLRNRQDIRFQIAGGNPRPREFYRSIYGRIARWLRVVPDVEHDLGVWVEREQLGGQVQLLGMVEDVDALLRQTDVLVFPSRTDGTGRSVFEAGVLGIPSVVTLRHRVGDIVEDGVTGLVAEIGDAPGIARAIARLADDDTLRRRLGENARARFAVQFDPVRLANEVLDLYHVVLADQSPATARQPRGEDDDALQGAAPL